jgi:hypothetical protein
MEKDFAIILELLEKKGVEGLHWYKLNRLIEITNYSFVSGNTLGQLTHKLLDLALIEITDATGTLAGHWLITDKGKQWLASKNYSGSLADELLSNLIRIVKP